MEVTQAGETFVPEEEWNQLHEDMESEEDPGQARAWRPCQKSNTLKKMQATKAVIGMILKTEKKDNCQPMTVLQQRIPHLQTRWSLFSECRAPAYANKASRRGRNIDVPSGRSV